MATNDINESKELLNAIGDMSFLPKEAKDENEGRDFPKIKKKEGIFRIVWTSITAAATISFLVCLFIYGINGYYFSAAGNGSYGIWGVIVTAIFAIVSCLTVAYSHQYEVKYSILSDAKKVKTYKDINLIMYYVCLVVLYATFMSTVLRSYVFQKSFFDYGWFVENLGLFTFIIICIVAIGGIVLHYVKPNVGKIYDLVVLALSGWVVIFYSNVLTKNYSLSSNYGIVLLVFGAIFFDLCVPFIIAQKKYRGFRSVFSVLFTLGVTCEALAVLIYGMATLR